LPSSRAVAAAGPDRPAPASGRQPPHISEESFAEGEASGSFLKKEPKLLFIRVSASQASGTLKDESICFFFQKEALASNAARTAG
jgi:hypothetical protein